MKQHGGGGVGDGTVAPFNSGYTILRIICSTNFRSTTIFFYQTTWGNPTGCASAAIQAIY